MEWQTRFWTKVHKTAGCWNWTAYVDKQGYGMFRNRFGTTLAHRRSYEILRGPIPKGKELDHLCRNRRCVNPKHLEPVSHRENMLRSPRTRIVNGRCKRGHSDLIVRNGQTDIYCRACRQMRDRGYYRKRKIRALTI